MLKEQEKSVLLIFTKELLISKKWTLIIFIYCDNKKCYYKVIWNISFSNVLPVKSYSKN